MLGRNEPSPLLLSSSFSLWRGIVASFLVLFLSFLLNARTVTLIMEFVMLKKKPMLVIICNDPGCVPSLKDTANRTHDTNQFEGPFHAASHDSPAPTIRNYSCMFNLVSNRTRRDDLILHCPRRSVLDALTMQPTVTTCFFFKCIYCYDMVCLYWRKTWQRASWQY